MQGTSYYNSHDDQQHRSNHQYEVDHDGNVSTDGSIIEGN